MFLGYRTFIVFFFVRVPVIYSASSGIEQETEVSHLNWDRCNEIVLILVDFSFLTAMIRYSFLHFDSRYQRNLLLDKVAIPKSC